MTTTKTNNTVDFRADVTFTSAPLIEKEYTDQGVRFYQTKCGKLFHADSYDKVFKADKQEMKPLHHKGANACKKHEWLK